jgi:hypothetical protein
MRGGLPGSVEGALTKEAQFSMEQKSKSSGTLLIAYTVTKAVLAFLTLISGEAALLNYDRFDVKTVAITLGMALAVVFIVEAFLLKDAIENLIARGVAAWIRDNIEHKDSLAPAAPDAGKTT